ncbi:hypothetical protein LTR62_000484 [Meristemomyces frigidus]|uniref:Guanine nucleotide-binding protein-like 3 N-terminal domain-containing protein n=1 Tax=Meristemomyces frigidus TaxID=1508187 RepID=A0AAN7YM54_9PEZI|nr:hypothetical protein LTR62_000484 [Meristemomyces frigidus]
MKVGKPTSKRVTVRLRHKIQKASSAKQKKNRKEAKKNPQWVSRLKKDPGIPNMFPYKAKVLAEIEESRRRKEEDAQQRRDIAKAQRLGRAVVDGKGKAVEVDAGVEDEDRDEELLDFGVEDLDEDEDEEMEAQDDSNPMAALLASAQARAQVYSREDENEDDEDENEDDHDSNDEWDGIAETPRVLSKPAATSTQPTSRKALPKAALVDPVKAITTLITRMQQTTDGIQRLIEHYQIPPLVTAGSDTSTRFLVDVARKRGRLGRGGVPNLNAAALIVLTDLNLGNLILPSQVEQRSGKDVSGKSGKRVVEGVQVVSQMAKPFSIEGLFGGGGGHGGKGDAMVVEA